MEHPLVTALSITAIGMTLLFLALVLFYGLMASMMSILHRRPAAQEGADQEARPEVDRVTVQAAAIAVALARAEAEREGRTQGSPASLAAPSTPSLWWTLHHHRQVTSPARPWRTR